jgi:hypothetical protein
VRQAKEDDMVYTRILSVDNNVSMDDKSDMKKKPVFGERKTLTNLDNKSIMYIIMIRRIV